MKAAPVLSSLLLCSMFPLRAEIPATSATTATIAVNSGGEKILAAFPPEQNVCLSPFSIQSALAMTYAGASGETKTQMASALGFPESADSLAESFEALGKELLAGWSRGNDPDMTLDLANRLFGQTGFQFRPAFLELTSSRFAAPLEELDFKANPAAAAGKINAWVEQQTRERIRDLIPADALDETTTLVLANALYFKMPWAEEFSEGATRPGPFKNADGSESTVLMMNRTDRFGYAAGGNWTLVTVPFRSGAFQFVFMLPGKEGPLPAALPAAELLGKAASLPRRQVALSAPKFRLEPPTMPLGDILKKLGMPNAFDIPRGSADFDAMAPRRPDDYLYLSEVFHKTFLDLGEKGVEAAAATAVVMMRATSMPMMEEPVSVVIDRPFAFAIQHTQTGTALFLGRVSSLPSNP